MTSAFQHDHIDAMREDGHDRQEEIRRERECECPPRPYWPIGSVVSGSATEEHAQAAWDKEHGSHLRGRRNEDLRLVRQMLAAVYEPHEYEEVMRRLEHG